MSEGSHMVTIGKIKDNPNNPRLMYDKQKMAEMVESVKEHGILEPILVRTKGGGLEIIAGSRRFQAATAAMLKEIPVIVMDVETDGEAFEISIVENMHSEDVHELDEALSLKQLLGLPGYDIVSVAAKVSKDESYVYKRLKLLDLIEPAQKAFIGGEINAGHALLIARLQPDDQKTALENCFKDQFGMTRHGAEQIARPVKELAQWINSNVHLVLSSACFKSKDDSLIPDIPSCKDCYKRTGFNSKLFSDIAQKDICTDPKCFSAKQQAHIKRRLETKSLVQISTNYDQPKDKAIIPSSKYIRIDNDKKDRCSSRQKAIVVEGHRDIGLEFEICANEKCAVHGRSVAGRNADTEKYAKQQKREEEKRKLKREVRHRVLDAVLDRVKEALTFEELQLQILGLWSLMSNDMLRAVSARRKMAKIERKGGYGIDYDAMILNEVASLAPDMMTKLAVEISLAQQMDSDPGSYGGKDRLMEFAHLKKINVKDIEAKVAEEFKVKAEEKAQREKGKKAKGKRFSSESKKPEADPAETICENCAGSDAEERPCGHVVCENCFSGDCPVCMEEGGE